MINMYSTAPRCLESANMAPVASQMANGSQNVVVRTGTNANGFVGSGSAASRSGQSAANSMNPTASGNGVRNMTGASAGSMNQNTNQNMNDAQTGMESEIAPYMGADSEPMPNDNGEYGPGYDWTPEEEEGMTSIPQDDFDQPMSATEAARNSWRALLARNIGRNVLVSFLVGTQNTVVTEGELYEVGTDYLVIYQPAWDSHISADLYAVKFVEFREPPGQQLG